MKVDLSKLLDENVYKIDLNESVDIKEIEAPDRVIKLEKPVKVKGSIYKTDDSMVLDADIKFQYKDNCARCLKELTNKVETVLSGRLVDKSEKKKFLDSDDDNDNNEVLILYHGDKLELTNPLINTIILSLPMKILCDENCKGICSKCGKDLNEGQCDCEIDDVDPRLAKLKKLLD